MENEKEKDKKKEEEDEGGDKGQEIPQTDKLRCTARYYPLDQKQQERYGKCILWGRRGDNWKKRFAEGFGHSQVNWSDEAKAEWKANFNGETQDLQRLAMNATSSKAAPPKQKRNGEEKEKEEDGKGEEQKIGEGSMIVATRLILSPRKCAI